MKKKKKLHIEFGDYGILYALLLFWLILAITNKDFRGLAFYQNILTRASLNAICGIGMTFAIISGDFDLSVASQVALGSGSDYNTHADYRSGALHPCDYRAGNSDGGV